MPAMKEDYFNPWTPLGSNTPKSTFAAPSSSPSATTPGEPPSTSPDAQEVKRAMAAAFKTSLLCRTMLQVTKDGNYKEYPTGRHLDFAYEMVLKSMRAAQVPPLPADVQARIDAANKVLFVIDQDGNIIDKKPIYKNYQTNS